MSNTFMNSKSLLFTSESVTEGHPDKICDQISDAVLDWSLTQTPTARVACESGIKSDEADDWVSVFGEVTPLPPKHVVRDLVRKTLNEIGYTDRSYGTSGHTVHVEVQLSGQSADIALGVDKSLEAKEGETHRRPRHRRRRPGHDGRVRLQRDRVADAAADRPGPPADPPPDRGPQERHARVPAPGRQEPGHSRVPVRQAEAGRHDRHLDPARRGRRRRRRSRPTSKTFVINPIVPKELLKDTRILVNPTGRFVIGGPYGDSGLTGRKIIVDTYGGMARHGGGAFSGKDPTKVDRSAAYAARYVAKNVVAAGLAERFEVQLAYAIGVAKPVSIMTESFGTNKVDEEIIARADPEALRPPAGRDHQGARPAPADLPADGGVRPLRPQRHRRALGGD